MTQDYKDNLLKYLTGNLGQESGDNIPLFPENSETINKTIVNDITTILTNQEDAQNILVLGKLYNEYYSSYLVYGAYSKSNGVYYGYIYLVDDELNTIQMITEFSSGTKLFPITALNQAEDNNIYGLTYNISEETHITKVLLFNNIFASGQITGTYEAILRNDYVVPYNYSQAPYRQNRIIKSPDSSTYYIILSENGQEKIVRFTINVGAANEWVVASINKIFNDRFYVALDKSSGEEILNYYAISNETLSVYYQYKIDGESATIDKSIQLEGSASGIATSVFVKDINNIYIYACYAGVGKNIIYKVNGNSLIKIYEIDSIYGGSGYYITYITIFEINGGIFFYERYKTQNNWQISIGFIRNNNTYIKQLLGVYDGNSPVRLLYSYVADSFYKTSYNLATLYIPFYSENSYTKKITFDYNSTNYNGEEYTNVNSLVPNKARLYDNDNKMIFARNLYNKVINANTTISTLNVPNTNLNDVTIYKQSLVGETNYVLMNNQGEITKNIYENLNINFYVTLRMINNNDPNNQIFNQNGSNRINLSVSDTNDYDNAKATKIKINYSDDTTKITNIEFYPLKNYFYTKFILFVDKEISSIDFISNDENTIYNTIRPDFIIGKYYTINQSVRIDERIESQPILYNNEQLYYNNEEVYY